MFLYVLWYFIELYSYKKKIILFSTKFKPSFSNKQREGFASYGILLANYIPTRKCLKISQLLYIPTKFDVKVHIIKGKATCFGVAISEGVQASTILGPEVLTSDQHATVPHKCLIELKHPLTKSSCYISYLNRAD